MQLLTRITCILGLFFLTSCAITESFEIKEDRSGKFRYDIDLSQMMEMVGNMGAEEPSKSKKKKNKKKEEVVSRDMDTTFTFKSILEEKKDSIAKLPVEEQQKLKRLEKFTVHMVMNEAEKKLIYSMYADFDSIDELMEMMSPMQSMQSIGGGAAANPMANSAADALKDDSKTSYFYDGKVFKKIVAPGSFKDALKQELENVDEDAVETSEEAIEGDTEEEIEDSFDKMSESIGMIFEQSSYKMVYTFPKPVKSITFENAQFSANRKTITVDVPMDDYMEHPEKLSFEVVFE
jgi:flagellar hook-basal body complex protein FliE